jgi:hypothetical protein
MAKQTLMEIRSHSPQLTMGVLTQTVWSFLPSQPCPLLPSLQHESEQLLFPHAIHILLQLIEFDTVTGYMSTRPERLSLLVSNKLGVTLKLPAAEFAILWSALLSGHEVAYMRERNNKRT